VNRPSIYVYGWFRSWNSRWNLSVLCELALWHEGWDRSIVSLHNHDIHWRDWGKLLSVNIWSPCQRFEQGSFQSSIFWDIRVTPCSLLKVNSRFAGTFCLHLQGLLLHVGFLLAYSLTLKMDANVPPKSRLTFSGLHGIIS
jgi:hypothetical protein